jgi:hypothetical protein
VYLFSKLKRNKKNSIQKQFFLSFFLSLRQQVKQHCKNATFFPHTSVFTLDLLNFSFSGKLASPHQFHNLIKENVFNITKRKDQIKLFPSILRGNEYDVQTKSFVTNV